MAVTATGFITDRTLKDSVSAALHKEGAALDPDVYTAEVTAANSDAYKQILGHFGRLGYSKAQTDTWIEGARWQRRLARLYLLVELGGKVDQVAWERLLEKELERLEKIDKLTDESGTLLEPAGSINLFEIHTRGW